VTCRPLLALVAALVACQGAPIGEPRAVSAIPPAVGVGPRSTFVIATPAGLLGLDEQGRTLGRIVTLPSGASPSAPAQHPDGKRIFFALSQVAESTGFGSDIYSVNLDGSDLRPLIRHELPNVFYASPSFDTAGTYLYVHRRAAQEEVGNPGVYLQTEDSIERVDINTADRQKVITDGAEPAVVPVGKSIVFVHLDRGQQAGLWTAAVDGTRAEPLLKTGDRFWFLQAPRVAPSGRELVFSSAGRTRSFVPGSAGPRLAHLDIPSELYVASLDGMSLRSIATTMDDVVPAWSPDSSRIAYVALAQFYVISALEGNVISRTPASGFAYGDPVWLH